MSDTKIQHISGIHFDMSPDELGQECRELINIIAAEFESDPLSVQCFDRRIVERSIKAANTHRRYEDASIF